MSEYLSQLNKEQYEAVTHVQGPLLIVAGPGSGKTKVLTTRIAHLIEAGIAPWEILSLTFTNKAAKEMKERIHKVVGSKALQIWSGTFHSVFSKILRVESEKIGYPPDFTIYDTDDSKSLINSIVKELNLDSTVYTANSVLSRISAAKSRIIPPARYAQNEVLLTEDKYAKRPLFYKVYELYVSRCRKAGAMDFDDLLFLIYALFLKNPDILEKYRQKFKHVLVDEFQDTNQLQYGIIKQLILFENSPCNICVVGDDAQSIYAFRGATIQNILDFEQDFKNKNIKTIKLEQNYRSTEHIVQAANQVIGNNRRQIKKEIWTQLKDGQKIKLYRTSTDNEEGKRVVDMILEQKNRFHLHNNEIAILYRTNAQSRVFEEYLRYYNVPYKIFGGMSFYQRKEVKDLMGYLRLVVNPLDEEALKRVINYPKRGIGDTTIQKIAELSAQRQTPMWNIISEVELPTRAKQTLSDFIAMIEHFVNKAKTNNAYDLAMTVFRQSGLYAELKSDSTVEGAARLENINALLDSIKEFVDEDNTDEADFQIDKSLSSYLQTVALYTDADDTNTENDFVSLMTVHAAKGLEFKSVFVVGLEENIFPSSMASKTPEEVDEERRLFYVAITRAKELLTITLANSRYRFGQLNQNEPSRFIYEIDPTHLETNIFNTLKGFSNSISDYSNTPKSSVKGTFKTQNASSSVMPSLDLTNFKASSPNEIQAGMKVLHLKFGEGKVLTIEGSTDNRVATIFFPQLETEKEKRIMLKFAKLQII